MLINRWNYLPAQSRLLILPSPIFDIRYKIEALSIGSRDKGFAQTIDG